MQDVGSNQVPPDVNKIREVSDKINTKESTFRAHKRKAKKSILAKVNRRFFLLCCLSPSPSLIWLVHGVVRTFPLAIEHSTGVIELRRPMGSLAVLCAATSLLAL
jgi:hypothetical protein